MNSVKVLKICTQINTELAQKQKVIVLLRIVEYVNSYEASTEQEDEFITTVAESFNISSQEFNLIKEFTTFENSDAPNNQNTLIINDKPNESDTKNKRLAAENLDGELSILLGYLQGFLGEALIETTFREELEGLFIVFVWAWSDDDALHA